ncbi:NAD(P)H-binding protein [Streptomyces sp. NPDC048606]|uniref:NAD(P)H-binding protein n=1 Tax=Streptomyces sp. NPDC048606 TaxID=3154726 RepID=UPI003430E4A2
MTLVLGGNGKTGRRVVERLTTLHVPTRVGSRNGEPPFDWEDPGTWPAALEGVDRVYVAHPEIALPAAVPQIADFARAAVAAGAERLVLLSGRGSRVLRAAEEGVKRSGAAWTFLRPGWFNQNLNEGYLLEEVLAGVITAPGIATAEDFVDAEDIADVAVAALTGDGHIGRAYQLSGPRLLTFAEVAAELSALTGRTITFHPVSEEQYRETLRNSALPDDLIDDFVASLSDESVRLGDGVQVVLGRSPVDFSDYARRAAATGVWS